MNALLCIGCNDYLHMQPLGGAEKDAEEIFKILSNDYAPGLSRLSLSPTVQDIRIALNAILPAGREIGVFTFFFAGHAIVKAGSLYLCTKDADPDRLSMTAVGVNELFAIANEFHPREVNFILDACQAGGSAFDLNQLVKPEIVGIANASSVSFLGACAADEYALETRLGGVMTQAILRCINGEIEVQSKFPFLDLIDVAAVVGPIVRAHYPEQKPTFWGLSLFGKGRLTRNIHFKGYESSADITFDAISPTSELGRRAREMAQGFWAEMRDLPGDFCPRRLLVVLNSVLLHVEGDLGGKISFLRGVARTLLARAADSPDISTPSKCLATCALALLRHAESDEARKYVRQTIDEIIELDIKAFSSIDELLTRELGLHSEREPLADIYYLPVRVTNILGWLAGSCLLQDMRGEKIDGDHVNFRRCEAIINQYEGAVATVSDDQAAPIYIFLCACLIYGKVQLADRVLTLYFADFARKGGNVAHAGTDGNQALRYVLSLGTEEFRPKDWRPANPSLLCSTLLLFGSKLGMDAKWNLRALDRRFAGFFVPDKNEEFADAVIEHGVNYTYQIGFGIWTLAQFRIAFEASLRSSSSHLGLSPELTGLTILSALLFPDRLPFALECAVIKRDSDNREGAP